MASIIGASAEPQSDPQRQLIFSPNPIGAKSATSPQGDLPSPSGKTGAQRTRPVDWAKVPKDFWFFDLHSRPDRADVDIRARQRAATQNAQGPFGSSSLQFRTEKNFQTPEPFRRPDCANEEECADYSGFPRLKSPKSTSTKSVRKPFIGLSITTPLQH